MQRESQRLWYQQNRAAVLASRAKLRDTPEGAERERARVRQAHRKRRGAPDAPDETREGACYICGSYEQILMWDHNHKTTLARGWLCRCCNSGLGMFKDSSYLLEKAIEYLRLSEVFDG